MFLKIKQKNIFLSSNALSTLRLFLLYYRFFILKNRKCLKIAFIIVGGYEE
jgi:hypothetical protein